MEQWTKLPINIVGTYVLQIRTGIEFHKCAQPQLIGIFLYLCLQAGCQSNEIDWGLLMELNQQDESKYLPPYDKDEENGVSFRDEESGPPSDPNERFKWANRLPPYDE